VRAFQLGYLNFLLNFLLKERDLVCDPFAGSNVTGAAAEAAGRK